MDAFESPKRQHEFHGKRSAGYSAIATLIFEDNRNEFQLRRVGDTGCLCITNLGDQNYLIGTGYEGGNIVIDPEGTLTLKPGVMIGDESLEELVKRLIQESKT